MSCGKCFADARLTLESNPRLWMVRDIQSGMFFLNRASREWITWTGRDIIEWQSAVNLITHDTVLAVENAHSAVIKSGKSNEVIFRGKIRPHRVVDIHNFCIPFRCDDCGKKCAVILILATELKPVSFQTPSLGFEFDGIV